MEADLHGRSGEELLCVCKACFGVLHCVDFLASLDCTSVNVHERSTSGHLRLQLGYYGAPHPARSA